ncbi:MAG: EAL domain-containing protein [Pseudomonadota bacterium]
MQSTTGTLPDRRVLIVDDDPMLRKLMRAALEREGFALDEAADGRAAIARYHAWQPQVILLDVDLPIVHGFDVCRYIRNDPKGHYVPILMVTGHDDMASVDQSYRAGATDFIAKPVNWTVLAHRVKYVLRAGETVKCLHKSQAQNRAMLRAMPDALFQLTRSGKVIGADAGPHAEAIAALGQHGQVEPESFTSTRPGVTATSGIESVFRDGGVQCYEYELPVDGERTYFEARLVASSDDEALAIVRDITQRKQAELRIHEQAHFDDLTGLANRRRFRDEVRRALKRGGQRASGVAVMFLDLDRFKVINDTLGHTAGDQLIQAVADRLRKSLRSSDRVGLSAEPGVQRDPTIGRIGGDEFTILLTQDGAGWAPEAVAERIIREISRPIVIEDQELFVTPSIGIALASREADDVDTLLKHADTAMYQAKAAGRNTYRFYRKSMQAATSDRLSLERDLRKALDNGELSVVYQPQVELDSNRITGLEALLRWHHPERGLVSPAHFIPVADDTGLIVPLGEFVLHSVCAQHDAWCREGRVPMRIAVNVAAKQFYRHGLVAQVRGALKRSGMPPECLELELTEGTIMQDVDECIDALRELRSIGVRFSVDDFGTGYSSLSYLKRFPLNTLKIDQSFVREISTNEDDTAIVEAIIAMARGLQLNVIAEGVETDTQLEFLRRQQCDAAQGYLLGRPASADAVGTLLGDFDRAAS